MVKKMTDPGKPHRKSLRLYGFDYSLAGAYFVTSVTRHRENLFGDIVNGEMFLNKYGTIMLNVLNDVPKYYPHVTLDTFIVMPNHIHAIIVINCTCKGGSETHPYTSDGRVIHEKMIQHGLPEIMRAIKSFSARRINQIRNTPGVPI
jgi:hypothetical protein